MARNSFLHHDVFGTAILERFDALPKKGGPLVKAPLAEFGKRHKELLAAAKAANLARGTRDEALAAVAAADDALDRAVNDLADALVAAGLGARKNPFAKFSKHSPSELCALAYRRELDEVRALLAKIGKQKDAPKKAIAATAKAADAVEKALGALTKPQNATAKALAERDALLLHWQKSLSRLKKIAAAALIDDASTYRALFALPAAEQAPKRRAKSGGKKATKEREPAPAT